MDGENCGNINRKRKVDQPGKAMCTCVMISSIMVAACTAVMDHVATAKHKNSTLRKTNFTLSKEFFKPGTSKPSTEPPLITKVDPSAKTYGINPSYLKDGDVQRPTVNAPLVTMTDRIAHKFLLLLKIIIMQT